VIPVYFFGFMLVVLLGVVILAPLFERPDSGPGSASDPAERLAVALDALRELEFEFETGKIAEEDYHPLRAQYAAEAIAARDAGADDEAGAAAGAAAGAGGPAVPAGHCGVCGAGVPRDAKFCSRCGTAAGGAA
jgi:hypothetical protein